MIRNYRQIAKSGSRVTLIGVGKTQGGKSQLGKPKVYLYEMPFKPNHIHSAPVPDINFTIERG